MLKSTARHPCLQAHDRVEKLKEMLANLPPSNRGDHAKRDARRWVQNSFVFKVKPFTRVAKETLDELQRDGVNPVRLTEEVTPQWAVLPSCIFEDIIEILEIVIQSNPQQKPSSELFLHLDPTLLLYLVTFILGNGQHVKNPNLRGKAATILKGLIGNPSYCHLVENSPVLISGIIPGCIRVFTAVEKTKQSYYDIRMQLKYQLRIPIMELFERTLPLEAHKKALKSFAAEFPDEFLKFLNNLMNDATMQLEEGMDTLIEIRRLKREGKEAFE
ncbi:Ube4b [Symbiodinium sp. CCMP2592]|nr:Ube4b [Symbiodinium sp. CCMP2592]